MIWKKFMIICQAARVLPLSILIWTAVDFSAQQLNSETSTLRGTVIDAATGRPMPDAQVSTDRSRRGEFNRTDETGRFTLTGVPPGLRSIIVRKHGYAPSRKLGHWRSAAVPVVVEKDDKATIDTTLLN